MIAIKLIDSNNCLNGCSLQPNPKDPNVMDLCDSSNNPIRSCNTLSEAIQTAESISMYLKYQLAQSQQAAPNYNKNIEEAACAYFNKQYPGIENPSQKYTAVFDKYVNNIKRSMHENPTAVLDSLVVSEFEKLEEEA